jgi:hypothetical protein
VLYKVPLQEEARPAQSLKVPVQQEALQAQPIKRTIWADLNADPPALHANDDTAELCEGENGFAAAEFSFGILESEVPNLLLRQRKALQILKKPAAKPAAKPPAKPKHAAKPAAAPVLKKPAAAPVLKKPAAAGLKPKSRFSIMYYKNNNSIGLREKFDPKQQVFSFGGMKCEKTQAQLRAIGELTQARLDEGITYAEAKTWAVSQL